MTLEDYSLTAFTVLNGARIIAYLPQIICVCRDRTGASSVSMTTWGMFCSANVATVFYAVTVSGDRIVAIVFTLNAVACLIISALIVAKRLSYAWTADGFSFWSSAQRSMSAKYLVERGEDRIAAPYASDAWSDAVERNINSEFRNQRCGRPP